MQTTAASVEIGCTSCVARCNALSRGAGWLVGTVRLVESSRPMVWTPRTILGARWAMHVAMLARSLAAAADSMAYLHDRWIASHACVFERTAAWFAGVRSVAGDASSPNTMERSMGAVGAMPWFVVSNA